MSCFVKSFPKCLPSETLKVFSVRFCNFPQRELAPLFEVDVVVLRRDPAASLKSRIELGQLCGRNKRSDWLFFPPRKVLRALTATGASTSYCQGGENEDGQEVDMDGFEALIAYAAHTEASIRYRLAVPSSSKMLFINCFDVPCVSTSILFGFSVLAVSFQAKARPMVQKEVPLPAAWADTLFYARMCTRKPRVGQHLSCHVAFSSCSKLVISASTMAPVPYPRLFRDWYDKKARTATRGVDHSDKERRVAVSPPDPPRSTEQRLQSTPLTPSPGIPAVPTASCNIVETSLESLQTEQGVRKLFADLNLVVSEERTWRVVKAGATNTRDGQKRRIVPLEYCRQRIINASPKRVHHMQEA